MPMKRTGEGTSGLRCCLPVPLPSDSGGEAFDTERTVPTTWPATCVCVCVYGMTAAAAAAAAAAIAAASLAAAAVAVGGGVAVLVRQLSVALVMVVRACGVLTSAMSGRSWSRLRLGGAEAAALAAAEEEAEAEAAAAARERMWVPLRRMLVPRDTGAGARRWSLALETGEAVASGVVDDTGVDVLGLGLCLGGDGCTQMLFKSGA